MILTKAKSNLFIFMDETIRQLKKMGKERTAETYSLTLKSFMTFRRGQDIPICGIDSDIMLLYEAYLRSRGICMNTCSFYMRILRAVYNRAVEKGLADQKNPFRLVYTGIGKTAKRAVSTATLRAIKEADLSARPAIAYARDLFMFSFYTRGMSFVDIAYLKKQDLKNGMLIYCRRKTGQRLMIKWEKCMADIVNKYYIEGSQYLFPIITDAERARLQYANALHLVNHHLKTLANMLSLPYPLTMYVARHSWASVAKGKNIPLSIISEGMGHDSETTTRIYLASLDTSVVDNANKKIIDL